MIEVHVPAKLRPLLEPARYKGAHGGRGAAKSHFFAQLAVLNNYTGPKRGVCIREVQNSIKDSVKSLVESKIDAMGLGGWFENTRDEIRGRNGSLMVFKGLQDYNADNIKSLEGFDWAWVEEAQSVSARSWRLLRPTIRKPDSEIWCSWNPRWDTDAVDEFFRGPHKPANATVVEINWHDNPWFPDTLRAEMERDYAANPEMAEHTWGGGYEVVSEGAYYATLLANAEKEGRIGHFPYRAGQRVKTSWDLGIADYMACWFIVEDGLRATVVDYYEASGEDFAQFVSSCMPDTFVPPPHDREFEGWDRAKALAQLGRKSPFQYAAHYLPHDVRVRELGSGGRHRYQVLEGLGVKGLRKGAAVDPEERIAAVRRLLPQVRFDDNPRVQLGLKRLRRYRKKLHPLLGYTGPLHDENSHGCLVAGSMVRMACGQQQAIETVKAGQLVWTPSGNCSVLWSGFVKMSQELVDIETACGQKLTCTREHKILTEKGFIEAGSLSTSMMIWTGHGWKARLIGYLSRVSGIGFRALITGELPTAGTISTGLFGRHAMARYQTATMSTIRMKNRSTIHSIISSAFQRVSISVTTQACWLREGFFSRQETSPGCVPLSGTVPTMGGVGIRSMPSTHGAFASSLRKLAWTAARLTTRLILTAPCTARGSARIRRVSVRKAGQSVFDLTVERSALYQANGICVSNSDAFGEYAVNAAITPAKAAPAPAVPKELIYTADPATGQIRGNLSVKQIVAAKMREQRLRRGG